MRVVELLFAGTSLDKARRIFERTTQHRPRIRLTIRQRMRVLDERPRDETIPLTHGTKRAGSPSTSPPYPLPP
jgi:hypothetical protein